jgi:cellulose synthase (UDP-forming)
MRQGKQRRRLARRGSVAYPSLVVVAVGAPVVMAWLAIQAAAVALSVFAWMRPRRRAIGRLVTSAPAGFDVPEVVEVGGGETAQALLRIPGTRLRGLGLLMALAAAAAALLPREYTVSSLPASSIGVSLPLGVAACSCVVSLVQAWRGSGFPAEAPQLHVGRAAGSQRWRAAWQSIQCAFEARRSVWPALVPAVLLLAVVASLLWLVWQRPGPWEKALACGLTILLAARNRRWLERRSVALAVRVLTAPVRYFSRWIGAANPIRRLWREAPATERATIALIVLLNGLVAVALLNTSKTVYGVVACLDFILLDRCIRRSSRTDDTDAQPSSTTRTPTPADELKTIAAPAPTRRRSEKVRPALVVATVVVAAVWIGYAHPGALVVLGVLVVGLAVPFTTDINRDQAIAMVLAVAVGAATIDYVSWRFGVTNWHGWWIAGPLLFAETLGALHVIGFQFTMWPSPTPPIESAEDPTLRPIFIFVPALNEGVQILRPTLEACIAARARYLADHPHGQVTIAVCNDGRAAGVPGWGDLDTLAKELGVRCVTRVEGGGAKAGNIEAARQRLQATGDALVVIFDADQVPKADFLLKTIAPFGDSKVGWVQTGQYYANVTNPVSRWADDQQSMFYNLLCPGKAAHNAAFICGTNVVIRAAALDEIGGLPQDSVTEDFAASVVLHPRWRGIYLTEVLATGLGPLDVPSYLRQQSRWALGTLTVLRTHWREILLPRRGGLRLGQRVQYFLACTHYLCGLRDLIYVVSPMLFIFTGVQAVRSARLSEYLWHFLPYSLLGLAGLWYSARSVTGLRGIIIGFGSFPALLGSLVAVVLRRKVAFAVTSKQRRGKRSLTYLSVYGVFAVACIVCLVWATQVRGQQETSLFISVLWVAYSLTMLGSFLWLAFRDIRFQDASRRAAAGDEVSAKLPYPSKLLLRPKSLKPVWNLGLAAFVASPLLMGGDLGSLPIFATTSAKPFLIDRGTLRAPYVGVSVPVALLRSQPAALARDLGVRFSIVGRTQDIHDGFDRSWADALAARGARPWITLQFGVFDAQHKPPLDANLPAIVNGLRDRDIARWAAEIRDFGRPVYLTVLLHADKNWSVSSGVANGGIPQDVPKAWLHVRSIFRATGARNVAWIWAPADPARDQAFAPPASAIDGVLQSFINYPGTRWGDPTAVLHTLTERYPGKPLLIEASAAGSAAEKAAWLGRLGQALAACPQAHAFLYHEGGPGLRPAPAQVKAWSLASDAESLAAMRRVVTNLAADRAAWQAVERRSWPPSL